MRISSTTTCFAWGNTTSAVLLARLRGETYTVSGAMSATASWARPSAERGMSRVPW